MKIAIKNDEENILVVRDFDNMNCGLIAQTILELEILKKELLNMYEELDE